MDSFGLLKKTKRSRQRVDAGEPRNSYSSIPNFSSRPNLLNSGIYGAFFAAQQNHHNFGSSAGSAAAAGAAAYFNQVQGFGPTKMLNELLSRRVKTIADGADAMMTIDVAANDVSTISGSAYDCLNSQSPVSRVGSTLNGGGGSSPVGDMAQHMLRNILSGKRKEIYALEQELRGVSGANNNNNNSSSNNNNLESIVDCNNSSENSSSSANAAVAAAAAVVAALNNNNNSSSNNNNNNSSCNNNNNNNDVKIANLTNGSGDRNSVGGNISDENCASDRSKASGDEPLTNGDVINTAEDMDTTEADDRASSAAANAAAAEVSPLSGQNNPNDSLVDKLNLNHRQVVDNNDDSSASEHSVSSSESASNKEDADESNECSSYPKTEQQVELKRARVENIVSSMRSSPLPVPVNGCKKRKLYHPQQHDNSVAERYAASLNEVADALSEDEDENLSPAEIRQKVVEKNALKNQLRTMQEQLAEMQQKYVQLCTRMDQDSVDAMEQDVDLPNPKSEMEQDETASDADHEDDEDDDNSSVPASPTSKHNTPAPTPVPQQQKDHTNPGSSFPTVSTPVTQSTMSPAISKMLGNKFLPQNPAASVPHMNSHPFPIHPNFNGALSFLQHQMFQDPHNAQNHLQPHHHHHPHHPPHPHSMLSNAAAMYLGVGHKLFMEQEARMAEKVALAAAAAEHQQQISRDIQHSTRQTPTSGAENAHSTSQSASRMEPSSPNRSHHREQLQQPQQQSQQQQNEQSPKALHHQSEAQHRSRSEFADRLQMLKSNSSRDNFDFEGLAEALKSEISSTLSNLIDTIMTRFLQQKKLSSKSSEAVLAAEQLNKDLLMASQLIDRKSPRTKVIDRGNCISSNDKNNSSYSSNTFNSSSGTPNKTSNSSAAAAAAAANQAAQNFANSNPENNINVMNLPQRPTGLSSNLFGPPKMGSGMNSAAAAAAALYSSMNSLSNSHMGSFGLPDLRGSADGPVPEQHEALSLVVPQKKKRHKVTDTRITPRTVSRILAQDGMGCPPSTLLDSPSKYSGMLPSTNGSADSPPPRSFHIPASAPMLPVSLPTSVAIPNPGLHESQVYSPYSPFYGQHPGPHHIPSSSPPGMSDQLRDSPPLPHHSSLFHPAAFMVAAQQQQQQQQHLQRGNSPDYVRSNSGMGGGDSLDRGSDCNSMDGAAYDGMTPTSSTLSPMHLRKAKLMFFWVRYPSSAVLKMYFPDIKFNKNNTAQLVKWFSNFREFYYIQMEKYARQAISEGIKNADDLHVSIDCDIYRVLNLHYNRNNHIEVPTNFRYVVEQTLREFFKAIQTGKDQEQSWKKSIYKVISRLDDPVPENFKTPHFLEQLE